MFNNGSPNQRTSSSKKTTTTWCWSTTWILRWQSASSLSSWSTNLSRSFTAQLSHSSRTPCCSHTSRASLKCRPSSKRTPCSQLSACLEKYKRTTRSPGSKGTTCALCWTCCVRQSGRTSCSSGVSFTSWYSGPSWFRNRGSCTTSIWCLKAWRPLQTLCSSMNMLLAFTKCLKRLTTGSSSPHRLLQEALSNLLEPLEFQESLRALAATCLTLG